MGESEADKPLCLRTTNNRQIKLRVFSSVFQAQRIFLPSSEGNQIRESASTKKKSHRIIGVVKRRWGDYSCPHPMAKVVTSETESLDLTFLSQGDSRLAE
jgi:hypothetical protein